MFDRRLLSNFDWILFLLVMTISLIGVMAIYSASQGYTEPTRYWLRQLNWIALGTAAGFLVLLVDFRTIGNYAYLIHGGVVFSLLLLMVYGSGSGTVSVNRWFQVGPIAIQPSEFAKFSMVLALAFSLVHLFNFPADQLAMALPLVLPQFVIGAILGYTRVTYGLWASILLHALHNGAFISLVLLASSAG